MSQDFQQSSNINNFLKEGVEFGDQNMIMFDEKDIGEIIDKIQK